MPGQKIKCFRQKPNSNVGVGFQNVSCIYETDKCLNGSRHKQVVTNSQTCLFDRILEWFISHMVSQDSENGKVFSNKDVSSVSMMAPKWDSG